MTTVKNLSHIRTTVVECILALGLSRTCQLQLPPSQQIPYAHHTLIISQSPAGPTSTYPRQIITSAHPYFNQTSRFPPLPLRLLIIKKIHFTWLLWCHPTYHQGAAKRCCSTSAPAVRSACRTAERMPSQPRTRSAWRPDASVDMYLFTWFCWGRLGGLGGKLGK